MLKSFSNEKTFKALIKQGRPFRETVKYLLDCECIGCSGVARFAMISNAAVSQTLSGKQPNARVQDAISSLLEFDPWTVHDRIVARSTKQGRSKK